MALRSSSDDGPSATRWIVDQRGRKVALLDPMRLQLLHRDDVIDRPTLDRMMNDLEPGLARHLRRGVVVIGLSLGAIVVLAGLLWLVSDAAGRKDVLGTFLRMPGVWIGALSGSLIPLFAARRRHAARLPALLLEYRRCPHCGYDLQGLSAEVDAGGTVCPECACAWDLAHRPGSCAQADSGRAIVPPIAAKIGVLAGLLLFAVLLGVFVFGRGNAVVGGGPAASARTNAELWSLLAILIALSGALVVLGLWWKSSRRE